MSSTKNDVNKLPLVSKKDTNTQEIVNASKELIETLTETGGKINKVNSLQLTLLVKECVEYANSFKKLKGVQKKEVVIILLNDVFEDLVQESDMDDTIKVIVIDLIETAVEPAIDLAIFVAKQGLKVDKKRVKKFFSKLCPCRK